VLRALAAAEQPTRGESAALLHDPATIAAVAWRNLFRYEPRSLDVCVQEGRERGRLRVAEQALPEVLWAVEVNTHELLAMFRKRLRAWAGASGA
jgi:inosine-uridine nucleoside N-ribohydrolase